MSRRKLAKETPVVVREASLVSETGLASFSMKLTRHTADDATVYRGELWGHTTASHIRLSVHAATEPDLLVKLILNVLGELATALKSATDPAPGKKAADKPNRTTPRRKPGTYSGNNPASGVLYSLADVLPRDGSVVLVSRLPKIYRACEEPKLLFRRARFNAADHDGHPSFTLLEEPPWMSWALTEVLDNRSQHDIDRGVHKPPFKTYTLDRWRTVWCHPF